MDAETIDGLFEDVRDEVIGWRRQLHQNPELSYQEEETSRFVYETLESFGGLELSQPTDTSVVGRQMMEGGLTLLSRSLAPPPTGVVDAEQSSPLAEFRGGL
jgi:metal-dependent amidase/aminoacylase/carboxypeptidase family protein